ncbi:hypothetical protein BVG16_22510 [Paenibacillus selenitireducens]|uniref:Uncharacterized protein n=1 Tax=Paenibacillus selenitireducens TaxID=1324314 RepID=A0A1T2X702_9BACL|nr:hypothetical protein [Paenibacillus selenitireducens]OPA75363.1 hypothetical protein BVG16_22510 [Paenibacillus selenitireducens]
MKLELVALKIPSGWKVDFNTFCRVDLDDIRKESDLLWELNEDILQMSNLHYNVILDLGWYPAHNIDGKYTLTLVKQSEDMDTLTNNWGKPILLFKTRNIDEVIEKINSLLIRVAEGQIKIS